MANTLKASKSNVICGLGVFTHTTAVTGPYFVSARCDENPTSGVTITIAQSGSATNTVTSAAPTAAQSDIQLSKLFMCAAGDVITVTLASSTDIDQQYNTVKTTVVLTQGQGQ